MDITAKLYELSRNNKQVFNLMNKDIYTVHAENGVFYIDKQTMTKYPPKYFIEWIKKTTSYKYLYNL